MGKIQQYLSEHPAWAGLLFIVFGIVFLLGSVFDWNWVFGDINSNNFNLWKVDGLVNFFGRKTARIIFGFFSLLAIISGIVWTWIYLK